MRLDTLTLATRDLARSRAFYSSKLGFELLEERETSFVVDAGGVKLHVDKESLRAPLTHTEPRLVFYAEDLMRRCMTLRDLGVSVDGPRKEGRETVAHLADPDGHPIVLWERN
jgi:catechol 2,3-dioxygenase-like lactoylglutathione lyase family enzyme